MIIASYLVRTSLVVSAALVGANLAGPVQVKAATLDIWNFLENNKDLGTSATATESGGSGITIAATGYKNDESVSPFNAKTDLYGKKGGGDETGLGIANNLDHEILGKTFIQINFSKAVGKVTDFKFTMESTTSGERWGVFGSNLSNSLGSLLLTGTDEKSHTLGVYAFYNFVVCGSPTKSNQCPLGGTGDNNVLIGTIMADSSQVAHGGTTPIPPAMALFAGGVGLIGLLGRRRKQRTRLKHTSANGQS